MAVEDVAAQLLGYGCDLAEVTGGEPLLQPAVHPLIARLLDAGMTVLVETSGASDVSALDERAIKVMDLKCPGSGESARNLWSNLEHLTPRDEVKFVIADRADYEWAREVTRRHDLAARVNAVLMSCAFGLLEPAMLAGWILADRLAVRMQLQMHKHIWAPDARGV
jgi:7-carboxy-7-deazaguanine synthase